MSGSCRLPHWWPAMGHLVMSPDLVLLLFFLLLHSSASHNALVQGTA